MTKHTAEKETLYNEKYPTTISAKARKKSTSLVPNIKNIYGNTAEQKNYPITNQK